MRRLLIVPIVMVMAGCVPPKVAPESYGRRPTPEEARSAVESWTKQALKDPYSAVIETVAVGNTSSGFNGLADGGWTHGWEIWFQINAKNSFGAYVGTRTYCILWSEGQFFWKPAMMGSSGGKLF